MYGLEFHAWDCGSFVSSMVALSVRAGPRSWVPRTSEEPSSLIVSLAKEELVNEHWQEVRTKCILCKQALHDDVANMLVV